MKVLQFSGGIDSLATLFLKRDEWDDITVLWGNTRAAYPETIVYMRRIEELVPHFKVVHSNKPNWEKVNGIAVDVVPENSTLIGQALRSGGETQTYTSFLRCCAANLWEPMARACAELGATHIIRGQRNDDERKAPIRSGHRDAQGVLYEFPIENWSRAAVIAYCQKVCPEFIPDYYLQGETSSHDCWDCIAYLGDNIARIRNLPRERRLVVAKRLERYHAVLRNDLRPLEELIS